MRVSYSDMNRMLQLELAMTGLSFRCLKHMSTEPMAVLCPYPVGQDRGHLVPWRQCT